MDINILMITFIQNKLSWISLVHWHYLVWRICLLEFNMASDFRELHVLQCITNKASSSVLIMMSAVVDEEWEEQWSLKIFYYICKPLTNGF